MPRTAKSEMLHVIDGNPNNKTKKELHKRAKNEQNMVVDHDKVTPPAWLDTGAKKTFNEIGTYLIDAQIVNNLDVTALAIYCDTYYDYKACKRQIKKHGYMMADGKVNPFVKERRNDALLLDKYGRQLGLTPQARVSLAIHIDTDDKGGDDDFD
ncbi:phage terminase small subunit P27 family [Pediococcus inopinatus]|uniref:phage terminase small subunit P27 family n=1 Tax=Pediococcus inopinatus TaxID=114090 RepID=UPI002B257219|nr:phage terminase small subunit P27 family [Pediococcus inopinatus]WPC19431.1 phage terminase small subunit P27 family [Pediococcus inopinatus]